MMLDKMDWQTVGLLALTLLAYWACSALFGRPAQAGGAP